MLNLIDAAKELQMFTGNSDTGMRCPPEPDRNWFVMNDRELSKFVPPGGFSSVRGDCRAF